MRISTVLGRGRACSWQGLIQPPRPWPWVSRIKRNFFFPARRSSTVSFLPRPPRLLPLKSSFSSPGGPVFTRKCSCSVPGLNMANDSRSPFSARSCSSMRLPAGASRAWWLTPRCVTWQLTACSGKRRLTRSREKTFARSAWAAMVFQARSIRAASTWQVRPSRDGTGRSWPWRKMTHSRDEPTARPRAMQSFFFRVMDSQYITIGAGGITAIAPEIAPGTPAPRRCASCRTGGRSCRKGRGRGRR